MKWNKEDWVEQIQRQTMLQTISSATWLVWTVLLKERQLVTQARKFLRIAPSGKIAGQTYALAFFPDSLLPLEEPNGANLDLVRTENITVQEFMVFYLLYIFSMLLTLVV